MDLKILLERFTPVWRDFVQMMPMSRALLGQKLCWHNQAPTFAILPFVCQGQAVRRHGRNPCWQREVSPLSPAPALLCFQETNLEPFTQPLVSSLPSFPVHTWPQKAFSWLRSEFHSASSLEFQHFIFYSSCHNVQEEHLSCKPQILRSSDAQWKVQKLLGKLTALVCIREGPYLALALRLSPLVPRTDITDQL